MLINKPELMLCLSYLKYYDVMGFEEIKLSKEVKVTELIEHLINNRLVIQEEGGYYFTPLAQNIAHTIGDFEVFLHIQNRDQYINRKIYIKDENILCIDEKNELLIITYLPSLPLLVGACGKALACDLNMNRESYYERIRIKGIAFNEKIFMKVYSEVNEIRISTEIEKSNVNEPYRKEKCINFIIVWILKVLKTLEEDR